MTQLSVVSKTQALAPANAAQQQPRPAEPNRAAPPMPPRLPLVSGDDFLPTPQRWLSITGIGFVGALALAVGLSSVIRYDTKVKAQAVVRPAGEVRLVQAERAGTVEDVLVEENQVVQRGDLLATLDDSQLQLQKRQAEVEIDQLRLQQVQLGSQIQTLQRQIQAERRYSDQAIEAAQADLRNAEEVLDERGVSARGKLQTAQAAVSKAQAELKQAQADAAFAETERQRYAQLVEEGAIAQQKLSQRRQAVAQAQATVAAAQETVKMQQAQLQEAKALVQPGEGTVEMAQSRVEQAQSRGEVAIANLQREQEALKRQQIEVQARLKTQQEQLQGVEIQLAQQEVRATASGTLLQLNLRNEGQVIQAGQEIAQISPSGSPLVIKAQVSPQDIQQVESGQQVQMRVTACPYPDYGVLEGVVSAVAPDVVSQAPSASRTADAFQGGAGFFEVEVEPEGAELSKGSEVCALQAGMPLRADIIAQQDTVLRFLQRKARLWVDW